MNRLTELRKCRKLQVFEAKPNAYRIRPVDRVFTHAPIWLQGRLRVSYFRPSFLLKFRSPEFGCDQAPVEFRKSGNRLRTNVFQHFAHFGLFSKPLPKTVRTKDSKHLHLKVAFGRGGGLKSAFGRVSGVLVGSRERICRKSLARQVRGGPRR